MENRSKTLAEFKAEALARLKTRKSPRGNSSEEPTVDDVAVEIMGLNISDDVKIVEIEDSSYISRGPTGFATDEDMATKHKCWWDAMHTEKPRRVGVIHERLESSLEENKDRVVRVQGRNDSTALREDILRFHSSSHLESLKKASELPRSDMQAFAKKYDSVYFDEDTYDMAIRAVDLTTSLMDKIINGNLQNGMAVIRPPGHHAMPEEFNGFCFLNNVAIAAKRALEVHGMSKVLVVDFDVHHGQGIQRGFYSDPRVLYFSTHRYERGKFWPELRESDYDCIGDGTGKGFNINFPFDDVGATDADMLTVWQRILLPIAYEFNPDLVLISAGYDAAFGCAEGCMRFTPALYAHLVKPLMGLAGGKVAVILEGGYCLESLAESALQTFNTLLGITCPRLPDLDVKACSSKTKDMIKRCWSVLKPHWVCLSWVPEDILPKLENFGLEPSAPFPAESDPYEMHDLNTNEKLGWILKRMKFQGEKFARKRRKPQHGWKSVAVVYDPVMMSHSPGDKHHPERPERISASWERLEELEAPSRCLLLKSRMITDEEILLCHDQTHLLNMRDIGARVKNDPDFEDKLHVKSLYVCDETNSAAKIAAGSCLEVLEAVLNDITETGFAIVRPPGHHAEPHEPYGFCFYNNVAIMAKFALEVYGLSRILILDWDVHHGNGIQRMFESDPRVLYMSLHRFGARFFPVGPEGNYDQVGKDIGLGFNVNIPWNADGCRKKFSVPDYMAAFFHVVLPIAYEFDPELVLISAGFDALDRDPVEEKICLIPGVFAHLTHLLSTLADGRVVMALEGGYRVDGVAESVARCITTLLGDRPPRLGPGLCPDWGLNPRTATALRSVAGAQKNYWKNVDVHLPRIFLLCGLVDFELFLLLLKEICLIPGVFAHLTHLLSTLADGRVVMALEGGYRVDGVAESVARCITTLLGDRQPRLGPGLCPDWGLNPRTATALRSVAGVHKNYWKNVDVHLPRVSDQK
ncbi:unnamed protein product [Notodromas monacha]|uniref:Histone deacetylase domain-containing protein n=1 Tax=Notodromas monacha TaxID=399045 RepID=A0A7R9G951_9CRUS|nr:unnamed protein product [Notodromas monacha]CAG0912798.1 unnamed protein product [Notodromas monacha]